MGLQTTGTGLPGVGGENVEGDFVGFSARSISAMRRALNLPDYLLVADFQVSAGVFSPNELINTFPSAIGYVWNNVGAELQIDFGGLDFYDPVVGLGFILPRSDYDELGGAAVSVGVGGPNMANLIFYEPGTFTPLPNPQAFGPYIIAFWLKT